MTAHLRMRSFMDSKTSWLRDLSNKLRKSASIGNCRARLLSSVMCLISLVKITCFWSRIWWSPNARINCLSLRLVDCKMSSLLLKMARRLKRFSDAMMIRFLWPSKESRLCCSQYRGRDSIYMMTRSCTSHSLRRRSTKLKMWNSPNLLSYFSSPN